MTSMVYGKNVMTKLTQGARGAVIKETVSVISNYPLCKYHNLSYSNSTLDQV